MNTSESTKQCILYLTGLFWCVLVPLWENIGKPCFFRKGYISPIHLFPFSLVYSGELVILHFSCTSLHVSYHNKQKCKAMFCDSGNKDQKASLNFTFESLLKLSFVHSALNGIPSVVSLSIKILQRFWNQINNLSIKEKKRYITTYKMS